MYYVLQYIPDISVAYLNPLDIPIFANYFSALVNRIGTPPPALVASFND